jgi:hypothetical protein
MLKRIMIFSSGLICANAYGITLEEESQEQTTTVASGYLSRGNYLQNPYLSLPSQGGTANLSESQIASDGIANRIFSDGTWNVMGVASYYDQNGANNYGYGVNIFAQTGEIAGFSIGGFLTGVNPYTSQINPSDPDQQALGLSTKEQLEMQELFVEYKYSDVLQLDAGRIGINNSPWLTYYQNNALNLVTYQGALANVDLGNHWLVTALAFNQAQMLGETGFNNQTYYNSSIDPSLTPDGTSNTTPGTIAAGVSWNTPTELLDFRLWGYKFYDYSNLIYADSNLKLKASDKLGFEIGVQGALQFGSDQNILSNNGLANNINSNMLGLQLTMNYDWLELKLGYNNIWGPNDSFEGGNIVSPYTYSLATDPLYTTSWMLGLIDKSAGQAYKIAPTVKFLDDALEIGVSAARYNTVIMPASNEYDITFNYNVPQIKGFTIFAGYGYIVQPLDSESNGGNNFEGQIMLSYLY